MRAIGIHLDGQLIKAALIHYQDEKYTIVALRTFSADDIGQLKTLAQQEGTAICSGLETQAIFLRTLSLKLKSRSAMRSVLPFQLEPLIPFAIEETLVLPFFHKKADRTTDVLVYATTSNSLNEHLEKMQSLGFEPEQISCVPAALARTAHFFAPEYSSLFFFHLGKENSSYGAIAEGKIILSHSLSWGVDDVSKGNEERFQKEIDRIAAFLNKKIPHEESRPVLLSGEGDQKFKDLFQSCLPPSLYLLPLPLEMASYAIPIGLAFENLKKDKQTLQWRQGAKLAPQAKERKRKQLVRYVFSSIALCALIGLLGFVYVKKRENDLVAKLKSSAFPYTGARKVEAQVSAWETSLAKQKTPFPYFSSAPLVSEVLAWLSTHPKLKGEKESPIEIKKMHYQLVSFPQLDGKKEPYQAKVFLEFTSTSPQLANAFHETLKSGDPLVNNKKEIKWSAHQNSYQVSFFLQNKRGF